MHPTTRTLTGTAQTFNVRASHIATAILASPDAVCRGDTAYTSGNCPQSHGGYPTFRYGTVNGATSHIPYLAFQLTTVRILP